MQNIFQHLLLLVLCLVVTGCADASATSSNPDTLSNQTNSASSLTTSAEEQSEVVQLTLFLVDELDPQEYTSMIGVDNNTLLVWYTDKDAVTKAVDRFGTTEIKVTYQQAKYSKAVLEPILEETIDTAVIMENMQHIESIIGKADGLEIAVYDVSKADSLVEWLNDNKYQDYFYIYDLKTDALFFTDKDPPSTVIVPPNPGPEAFQENAPISDDSISDEPYETAGSYIKENISKSLYSDYIFTYEDIDGVYTEVYTLYCTDIATVQSLLKQMNINSMHPYYINYAQTQHSREYLEPILQTVETALDDLYQELGHRHINILPMKPYSAKLRKGKIDIIIDKGLPFSPYLEWVNQSEYQDLIDIASAPIITPS